MTFPHYPFRPLRKGRVSVVASASGERASRGQRPLAAGLGDGRKIPKTAKPAGFRQSSRVMG